MRYCEQFLQFVDDRMSKKQGNADSLQIIQVVYKTVLDHLQKQREQLSKNFSVYEQNEPIDKTDIEVLSVVKASKDELQRAMDELDKRIGRINGKLT